MQPGHGAATDGDTGFLAIGGADDPAHHIPGGVPWLDMAFGVDDLARAEEAPGGAVLDHEIASFTAEADLVATVAEDKWIDLD